MGLAIGLGVIILLWSFVLMYHNFLRNGNFFKIKFMPIIIAFLITALLTAIIRIRDNFFGNCFSLYHLFLLVCIFYGMYTEKDKERIKNEMFLFCKIFVYLSTIMSIIGFFVAFIKPEFQVGKHFIGIYKNRLNGVYFNSNVLGVASVVGKVCDHTLYKSQKKMGNKIKSINIFWAIMCFMMNLLSLFLSDSHGSLLFLIIYTMVVFFCDTFFENFQITKKDMIKKTVLILLFCVTFPITCFAARAYSQDLFNIIIHKINMSKIHISDNKDVDFPENKIEREPSGDPTSGRLELIKQGIEIFKRFPLMGIGSANIEEYGKRYLGDGGLLYPVLHNGYLNVLVSYGIIGCIVFFYFVFKVCALICNFIFSESNNSKYNILENMFAFIVSFGVYSFFETTMPSPFVLMSEIFWMFLGYNMTYLETYTGSDKK
jgi:O-antigen ligase